MDAGNSEWLKGKWGGGGIGAQGKQTKPETRTKRKLKDDIMGIVVATTKKEQQTRK